MFHIVNYFLDTIKQPKEKKIKHLDGERITGKSFAYTPKTQNEMYLKTNLCATKFLKVFSVKFCF